MDAEINLREGGAADVWARDIVIMSNEIHHNTSSIWVTWLYPRLRPI